MFFKSNNLLNPSERSEINLAMIVYFLYILVCVTGVFGPIVGFLIAFRQRKKAKTEIGRSHFDNQVRIGLVSFIWIVAGILLAILVAGFSNYSDLIDSYNILFLLGFGVPLLGVVWLFFLSLIGFGKAFVAEKS